MLTIGALTGFVVLLAAAVALGKLPLAVPVVYVAASAITYLVYAWDKSAARKGTWRIAERTLHQLALGGGWPGALLAQQTLRHKTRKRPFLIVFWSTVVLHCGVLAYLLFSFREIG